jgi:hypothetical protein
VSQAAFAQGTPTLLCHKLPLHGEHLHYCVTSCLCTGNTYIIVSQTAFAWGTPTLLCHKLPLHGEHLHYCVTNCLCTGNTYIIVSQNEKSPKWILFTCTSFVLSWKSLKLVASEYFFFLISANQKQELTMAAMFFTGSLQNEKSL